MAIQSARRDSPLLTKPEAAEYLRVCARKVDYLVSAGELASTRIGGRVLFARAELDRFIADKTAIIERPSVGVLAEATA